MRKALATAIVIASTALAAGSVHAQQQSVAGNWTLTVEHFPMKLVLDQKNTTVSGLLNWPHGDPIKLKGDIAGDTLTFSGDSSGENFTVHIDSTGSLKADGTLTGTLKAHFVDFNDAHDIVRQRDQEIPWTAMRGLHGIVHFPR